MMMPQGCDQPSADPTPSAGFPSIRYRKIVGKAGSYCLHLVAPSGHAMWTGRRDGPCEHRSVAANSGGIRVGPPAARFRRLSADAALSRSSRPIPGASVFAGDRGGTVEGAGGGAVVAVEEHLLGVSEQQRCIGDGQLEVIDEGDGGVMAQ